MDRARPIIYTNFLLRCLIDSIAVCARDSPTIASITLDGIPLTPKYLSILCCGLKDNQKLMNLSLTRCRIGDVGCDMLLGSLRNNPNLCVLNLSSCRLSNRSAMYLSLFLKRRKADLLQNIWEKSSLQSLEENSDQKLQGLHTLILNNNQKFGDTGVRQLSNALKSDVWLKSLSLRNCGINKNGAEIMIRLLHSNAVLTKLDLTENRIPINTLQMMLKILKRRRDMAENMKKRFRKDWRRKEMKIPWRKNRGYIRTRTERVKKYSFKNRDWKRMQRFEEKTKEAQATKEENCYRTKKLCDLETQLLNLIESNLKLKTELSGNKVLLDTEAQQRTKMENELQKVSLRVNDLKSKVVMLNCVSSKAYNESKLMKGLKYIFEKLELLSRTKQDDYVNEEVQVLNTMEPFWSTPIVHQRGNSFANCLQRRPYCPPLKI